MSFSIRVLIALIGIFSSGAKFSNKHTVHKYRNGGTGIEVMGIPFAVDATSIYTYE